MGRSRRNRRKMVAARTRLYVDPFHHALQDKEALTEYQAKAIHASRRSVSPTKHEAPCPSDDPRWARDMVRALKAIAQDAFSKYEERHVLLFFGVQCSRRTLADEWIAFCTGYCTSKLTYHKYTVDPWMRYLRWMRKQYPDKTSMSSWIDTDCPMSRRIIADLERVVDTFRKMHRGWHVWTQRDGNERSCYGAPGQPYIIVDDGFTSWEFSLPEEQE